MTDTIEWGELLDTLPDGCGSDGRAGWDWWVKEAQAAHVAMIAAAQSDPSNAQGEV